MSDNKWVTLTVTEEELNMIDEAKTGMEKILGLKLSRNAFVKRLLFASVLLEQLDGGMSPDKHSKAVQKAI